MPQIMKSSNPALNGKVFQGHAFALEERMSLDGTVNKTGILLLCSVATAAYAWHTFMQTRNAAELSAMLWIGPVMSRARSRWKAPAFWMWHCGARRTR